MSEVERIVEELRRSRKYGGLCADTLRGTAAWAVSRTPRFKGALKLAKRKLHQATGAFLDPESLSRIERTVGAMRPGQERGELRELCLSVLALHASTRERLGGMDAFYGGLFARLGPVHSILDLACGLHPFAIPWMPLLPRTRYCAADIDCRLIRAVSRFLGCTGRPGEARCADILAGRSGPGSSGLGSGGKQGSPRGRGGGERTASGGSYDAVFLLKVLPLLERRRRGAARAAVHQARARRVVVSFPVRTIGGRDRGMVRGYDALMEEVTEGWDGSVQRWAFRNELCFLMVRDTLR